MMRYVLLLTWFLSKAISSRPATPMPTASLAAPMTTLKPSGGRVNINGLESRAEGM